MSMLLQLSKFITTTALLGTLLGAQNQATETCHSEVTEDLRRSAVNKALEASFHEISFMHKICRIGQAFLDGLVHFTGQSGA